MERRWKSWFLSRGSPEMAEIRRLTSDIKSKPDGLIGPSDSIAMGTIVCEEGRSEYFACFRTAASSAAPPAITDVRWMYDGAHVWTLVTSQAMYLPADHAWNQCGAVRSFAITAQKPKGLFCFFILLLLLLL